MIIQTGYMQPTAAQRRMIREHGDDQFMGQLPPDFGPVPMFDGWTPALKSMIAIKLRCVGPHKDGWVGSNPSPRRDRPMTSPCEDSAVTSAPPMPPDDPITKARMCPPAQME